MIAPYFDLDSGHPDTHILYDIINSKIEESKFNKFIYFHFWAYKINYDKNALRNKNVYFIETHVCLSKFAFDFQLDIIMHLHCSVIHSMNEKMVSKWCSILMYGVSCISRDVWCS